MNTINTIMKNIENEFWNADEAFRYFYKTISKHGTKFADTRALFNIGFAMHKPEMRMIPTEFRKWNHEYAEAEWQWYLTGDKNIKKLGEIYGKIPPIWKRMADDKGNVNSNYGYQWQKNKNILATPRYQYTTVKNTINLLQIHRVLTRYNLQM